MTTDIDALVERLDWSKIRNGDTMVATGDDLKWLIAQLAEWPTRVDMGKTTNTTYLMGSAARTLLGLREENARLREAGVALALAAGKLNVALDGQERYRLHRQAVLSAMEDFAALGDAQVARHGAHR